MSYPGVTARSEGDFDAQPEIGGVESGFSDHVQVRFIIQRECQRNRSDFVFESDDPVDPEREFAFVMVPRPDVDAGAVIEVESAGDYRHVPFVEGVHVESLCEVEHTFDRVDRVEIVPYGDAGGGYAAADADCPVIVLGAEPRNGGQRQDR